VKGKYISDKITFGISMFEELHLSVSYARLIAIHSCSGKLIILFRNLLLRPSRIFALNFLYQSFFHLRNLSSCEGKGKAVPLQACSGPEGSRKLRLPDFMTTAQDGGKIVSLKHRPPLPPGNAHGTHFC